MGLILNSDLVLAIWYIILEDNKAFEDAYELTYAKFPTKRVWHNNNRQWKRRKCIGRVYYAHPSSGERFCLRMLLNIVKGPNDRPRT